MSTYPEHEKMHAVVERSQSIGEFIDWLRDEKHVWFMHHAKWEDALECSCLDERDPHDSAAWCSRCKNTGRYTRSGSGDAPFHFSTVELLAEFFEIDLRKIETEKRAMLAALRGEPS